MLIGGILADQLAAESLGEREAFERSNNIPLSAHARSYAFDGFLGIDISGTIKFDTTGDSLVYEPPRNHSKSASLGGNYSAD